MTQDAIYTISLEDGTSLQYHIRRSKKAKRIRLAVTPMGRVEVVVPRFGSTRVAHMFVSEKRDWLMQILAQMRSHGLPSAREGQLTLFGRSVTIDRQITGKRAHLQYDKEKGILTIHARGNKETQVAWIAWCKKQIQAYAKEKAGIYTRYLGISAPHTRSMNARTRWGSCSPHKNTIAINWRLIAAPIDVLDYVIAHEVSHLLHGNHGKKFWNITAMLVPAYKDQRLWLKRYGHALHRVTI